MSVAENDLISRPGHGLNWITIDEKGRVAIDEEGFRAYLSEDAERLVARRTDLVTALPRLPEIVDEDSNGKAADFVGMIAKLIKAAEAEREAIKAPFMMATRAIDSYYHTITDPLGNAKGRDTRGQLRFTVEDKMTVYQRAKAERERQAREEEARVRREEEERLRREAEELERQAQSEKDIDVAILADQHTQVAAADTTRAERFAAAPVADLSRTRSDLGAVASLRSEWTFRNLDRDKLDLMALRAHLPLAALEQAVRSFIKAGGRELAGVEVYEDTRTQVRA